MNNDVERVFYDAFKKSGNIGYFMLYSRLKETKDDDGI